MSAETLAAFAGTYCFGPSLSSRDMQDVSAASAAVGMEIAGEHTRIAFTSNPAGEVIGAVLNPARWQIVGEKIN